LIIFEVYILGQWNNWGEWSLCSRSCNSGLQNRTRVCISRLLRGLNCFGDSVESRVCSTELCPCKHNTLFFISKTLKLLTFLLFIRQIFQQSTEFSCLYLLTSQGHGIQFKHYGNGLSIVFMLF